jgi:hypothetical protein
MLCAALGPQQFPQPAWKQNSPFISPNSIRFAAGSPFAIKI